MRATEVLCEFDDRLLALEARTTSIERTLTVLDGVSLVFVSSSYVMSTDSDKTSRLVCEYRSQLDELNQELDNLLVTHKEAMKLLDLLEPRHNHILSYVHLAGHSVPEYSRKMRISYNTAKKYYRAAFEQFDAILCAHLDSTTDSIT